MSALPATVIEPLTRYLDEDEERSALDTACAALRTTVVDMPALFDWLQAYAADGDRKRRAQAALRAALGLPLIPGAPCRAG